MASGTAFYESVSGGVRTMMRLLGFVVRLMLGVVVATALWALAYRWIDPPFTVPMIRDAIGGQHVERTWAGLDQISPAMPRAVIGAEDSTFCAHNGFDLAAIEHAATRNATSIKVIGGSTISQQTAKNAFLWPGRSYLRKGLEAYFTVLIEALWGKRRIMEIYLNIAELGPGIYGVEAAAQHYFNVPAARLTPSQAARIAAILPQPIKRDAAALHGAVKRHARAIERRIGVVRRDAIDACLAG
jgi:monofunctional biosynthetic peptidoglycan transglycosylase